MKETPSSNTIIVVAIIVIISGINSLFQSDQTIYLYCTTLLFIFAVLYNKKGVIPTFLLNMFFQVTNIVDYDESIGISTTTAVNGSIVIIIMLLSIILIYALYYVLFKKIDYADLAAVTMALVLTSFGIFLNVIALEPISLVFLALVILFDLGYPLVTVYKQNINHTLS